jgi:hypothetical protein
MHHQMRLAIVALLAAAGCQHGAAQQDVPAPPLLSLLASLPAPNAPVGELQIAASSLHLRTLTALSDRAADAARVRVTDVELPLGASLELPLPAAPPGLYSGVGAVLDGDAGAGVAVAGAWNGMALHVQVRSGPFDIGCAAPAELDPGGAVRLELRADPSRWFDGVDLATALSDEDDDGIVINAYDNPHLAMAVLANVLASFTLDCRPTTD